MTTDTHTTTKTGPEQRVRCENCGWTGLLSVALELSHGIALCPDCDERNLRNVAPSCACGGTNTDTKEKRG